MDKKSEAWKEDMDITEKKRYKNLFAKIKRAVRMVLMHTDDFPLIPDNPSDYKEVLRRTASSAEERIRNSLGFGDKRISFYMLTNHPGLKELEAKLNLPANTPNDWQKFFKS